MSKRKTAMKSRIHFKMFYGLLIIYLPIFILCCRGLDHPKTQSTAERKSALETPPKDSLDSWCYIHADSLKRVARTEKDNCDFYYYRDHLFNGWACRTLADNIHRYRYEQFVNGKMVWRIGYYYNGQVDADFRMKDCKNYGPSRMWMSNGEMYIDEFYLESGIKHGIHRRWHENGTLLREAKYEHGELIYDKEFDKNGVLKRDNNQ